MMSSRAARIIAAAGAFALLLAAAVGYVVYAANRGADASTAAADGSAGGGTPPGNVAGVVAAGPYYAFKSSALDRDFGRVAVASTSDPGRRVFVAGLRCNRLAVAGGHGLCLQLSLGVTVGMDASVLDANLTVTHRLRLPGYPSRAKIAPDGRLGAVTAFVSGDSYASMGFSTRTSIIDLATGQVLFDLEKLSVTKNGQAFHAADFNFWGVTFQPDSRHFFATLGSGGQTYLVHGDVASRTATVVTTGVECPSLSPDGRLIAFKKRVADDPVSWRLWILDVASGREHPTSEARPIDDQAAWLDDRTVMYGLAATAGASAATGGPQNPSVIEAGTSIDTSMWAVPADGTGTPRLVLDHAWSAQLASAAADANASSGAGAGAGAGKTP
ncbi:MAG TPA: hypothetical protein VMT69_01335 [Kineosporiaceae bacterium]|nr:hypothetical protein [Kineosporiaceae bacterium]